MLYEKIKTMIATLINKLTNMLTSPIERLEYLQEKREEELRKVLENVTILTTNIKELESSQMKILAEIGDATTAAEVAVKNGIADAQVLKIITRKNSRQASYSANEAYIIQTKEKLEELKLRVKEYESGIDDVKLQITQLNTESKISGVKVKIAETTAGLGENDAQIQKNIKQGREAASRESARADAILELSDSGTYDSINGKGGSDGLVNGILAEDKAKADLEAMKAKFAIGNQFNKE
jgi:phage shock protein A